MTFCSAPSRIAQVLMTTRFARLERLRLLAAGRQQPPRHLLGVAPVHLAAERPDVEPGQAARLGQVLGEPVVAGRRGSARARRSSTGRSRAWAVRAAGSASIDRSWLCRRAYDACGHDASGGQPGRDLGRDPQPVVRFGIGARVAVVVTPAGRDEAKRCGDLADRDDRRRVERAVVDLETAEPGLDELADDLDPCRCLAEMGQRPATRRRSGSPRSPRPARDPSAVRRRACPSRAAARTRPRRSSRVPPR